MEALEYALEEVQLDSGRRHIVLNQWSEDIDLARDMMKRFAAIDSVYVEYGGKRTKTFRIVSRPKVVQYRIVEGEA